MTEQEKLKHYIDMTLKSKLDKSITQFTDPVVYNHLKFMESYLNKSARPLAIYPCSWDVLELDFTLIESPLSFFNPHRADNAIFRVEEDAYIFSFQKHEASGTLNSRYLAITNPSVDKVFNVFKNLAKKYTEQVESERAEYIVENSFNRLILPKSIKEDIFSDIQKFMENRKFYTDELKAPWKRGYLLAGPPGNGKTLLLKNIVGRFGFTAQKLENIIKQQQKDNEIRTATTRDNLSNSWIGIRDLERIFFPDHPTPQFVYIEDLEKQVINFHSDDQAEITLASVLNAIDGLGDNDGTIFIATTNDLEILNNALVRPGRIDKIYTIDNPAEPEIKEFLDYFHMKFSGIGDEQSSKEYVVQKLKGLNMSSIEEFIRMCTIDNGHEPISKEKMEACIEKIKVHNEMRKKMTNLGFQT